MTKKEITPYIKIDTVILLVEAIIKLSLKDGKALNLKEFEKLTGINRKDIYCLGEDFPRYRDIVRGLTQQHVLEAKPPNSP